MLSAAGLLTLARIPLGIAFLWVGTRRALALSILVLAAASDVLDGAVARRRHETSALGAIADPLADKWFAACVAIALLRGGLLDLRGAIELSAREIGLLLLALYVVVQGGRARAPLAALPLGKATTFAQFVTVAALVARSSFAGELLIATAVIGVLAAAAYWNRELAARD